MMKSKNIISFACYLLTVVIFLAVLLIGKFYVTPGGQFGFVIFDFYIIMPLTTLVIGFLMGFKNAPGKWVYPIVFGFAGVMIPTILMNFNLFSLLFAAIPALVGMVAGVLLRRLFIAVKEKRRV